MSVNPQFRHGFSYRPGGNMTAFGTTPIYMPPGVYRVSDAVVPLNELAARLDRQCLAVSGIKEVPFGPYEPRPEDWVGAT